MAGGSGGTLGVVGWLVAAAVGTFYVATQYDVTIRERGAEAVTRVQVGAQRDAPPAPAHGARPDPDSEFRKLAALARSAPGDALLSIDQLLETAEREFPADYRFTYERAVLAVYGHAEHHEAFHHLRKAAEKAIRTERSKEMFDWLARDGNTGGRLRKLALGHGEWKDLCRALQRRDAHLWEPHAEPELAPRRRAGRIGSVLRRASALIESGRPCSALLALRVFTGDREADEMYRDAHELCLDGPGPHGS